jgi:hypothetical protein
MKKFECLKFGVIRVEKVEKVEKLKECLELEKVFFNHKVRKEGTKYTKVKIDIAALCDLCENTL